MNQTGSTFRPLSPARLERFRTQILGIARDQAEQTAHIKETLSESGGHAFGVHQDWGTDTQTKNVAAIQQNIYNKSCLETEKALARINDGTYGKCLKCHNRIEMARLEAIPTTELCCGCSGAKKH